MKELIFLAAAYTGYRLFEKFKEKKATEVIQTITTQATHSSNNVSKKARTTKKARTGIVIQKNTSLQPVDKQKNSQKDTSKKNFSEKEKEYNHFLKATLVSAALTAMRSAYPPLNLLTLGVITYTSLPIFKLAEKSIRKQKIGDDILKTVLISLCVGTNQYFAASLVGFFHYLGKKLLAKTQDDSQKMVTNLFEKDSLTVWVLKNNVEIEIPLEEVEVNDIVIINTGELIMIDGIIIEGQAMIEQYALTGESQPAEKKVGDKVFASTVVIGGKINVKIEKAGKETTICKIGNILNRSVDFKSGVQSKGEEWADKSALPLMAIAAVSIPLVGPDAVIPILCSGFGNRISVLAPLNVLNHLKLAANEGILIKDGRSLELLKDVDTIIFDKTGTLTTAQPKVGQIIVCNEYGEDEILTYAAAVEGKLTHPIAQAILKKAEESKLILPEIEDSKYQMGYGMTAEVEDKVIAVGSVRFMTTEGIVIPDKIENALTHSHNEGHSLVIVAINRQVCGAIEMQPTIRPEVKGIINDLRLQGKHLSIVSGDHEQPTKKLAEYLGMDSYFYDILPQDKAKIVTKFQKQGKSVCFIGDGINDTIAMKKANVSISLKGASSIATDVAQIVLMNSDLVSLDILFNISKNLEANLQKSFTLTLIPGITNVLGVFFLEFDTMTSLFLCKGMGWITGLNHVKRPLKIEDNIKKVL
ncbi:heavy metal translocating P-type ATPase [Candidatus Parabeggiatoa sp. HSG14]|uniref:heavy metal translocating P-type ATPase n=1 Tax=Candidatus Parabeggiatoa sp. HSG14 TaxID=3055593 RepID=UPI0025A81DCF|nr:heavy metal translocating P-type ATPase [Thiotrichales bacterium HSG14]